MEAKKILWVRLDAIGDNVLSASMIPHIYEQYNAPRITVVCQQHVCELYETNPQIEKVIGVDKMRMYLDSKYRSTILRELQEEKFDLAFDTTYTWEELTSFLAVGSMAGERITFENQSTMPTGIKGKASRAFTRFIKSGGVYQREVDKYVDFLRGLGIEVRNLKSNMWTTTQDEKFAEDLLAQNKLDPARTIAVFAFGRSHLRTYPYYGNALSNICRENGFSVVALGDGAAYGINQACLDDIGVRSVNLSGKTTLRQTAAILRRCRLALGAETGIAHIACAVDVPNVIIIGGGHYGRFMPYSSSTSLVALPLECYWCDWDCRYDYSHCVVDIAPEVVEFAIRETLRTHSEKPRLFLHPQSHWNSSAAAPSWKMVDKFTTHDNVEIITVEFEPKFNYSGFTKLELERRFSKGKSTESPEGVLLALKIAGDLREQGKLGEALEVIEKGISEYPGFPDLLNFGGELEITLGAFEQARSTLWSIITLFPSYVNALNNIVVLDIMEKRYESAIGLLQKVLDIDSSNAVALLNLQFIKNDLVIRGKLVQAEGQIISDDLETARGMLNEILNVDAMHEEALIALALVEPREGNHSAALKNLQKVLNKNPGNEDALQLMEKLLFKE